MIARLISYIRSVHQESTPDSWSRWAGTVYLLILALVVVAVFFGHALSDTLKGLLADVGYAVLGGGAVRKGFEVWGGGSPPSPPSAS